MRETGGRTVYANLEAGWRRRGEVCEGQILEASVGAEITEGWPAGAKARSGRSLGQDRGSAKVETMLCHDWRSFTLGLGYRAEISGAFRKAGVLAAPWTRF